MSVAALRLRQLRVATAMAAALGAWSAARADDTYPVFERVEIAWDESLSSPQARGPYLIRGQGQIAETTMRLPDRPDDHRLERRIVAEVRLRPVPIERDGQPWPGDPWTRIGSLSLVLPAAGGGEREVEIMRFASGFGGRGTFVQDVTAMAPVLAGECTLRLFLSTFARPAWEADVYLTWSIDGVGQRRPVMVAPLFNSPAVTAESPLLEGRVEIPSGLAQPRIRVLTTGHASDGMGGDEFETRTHILRIDGREVCRWRPWSERGGEVREQNPAAGRRRIEGRVLWSSDLDRSGWTPGLVVEPTIIAAPELSPGPHHVQLEVQGIRPGSHGAMGYWRISAVVVADEPWPGDG